jgi:hypothetical protein
MLWRDDSCIQGKYFSSDKTIKNQLLRILMCVNNYRVLSVSSCLKVKEQQVPLGRFNVPFQVSHSRFVKV